MELDGYMQTIHKSRYARYIPSEKRRESWEETVSRYIDYFIDRVPESKKSEYLDIKQSIINLDLMPSMRAMMTAGLALDRDNVAAFNCSYLAIDHPRAFDELMYILLCGTGVGYSVEEHYIRKLPEVAETMHNTDTCIMVADSKIGWASAFRELVSLLYAGKIPTWNLSKVRPAGAPLKTFGGRASGPFPLKRLFEFTVQLFKTAKGRRLNSLECHDLCCKIADIVVVGGVRRSALISLSDLRDDSIRRAKYGQWWDHNPHRRLANNSACYSEKPDLESFLHEWVSLYASKSGERGIFSRVAAQKVAARNGRRDADQEFGTNPCSEIILRSCQFCNLSEIVARPLDSLQTLKDKARKATVLGTLQSTLCDFRYLRSIWKKNTEEERLLGVSLTGIEDHEVLNGSKGQELLKEWLCELREACVETNAEWAGLLGIPTSTAITCVKPSGTVSQLVDSASGIHPRFSPYYIRRVRFDYKDPLCEVLNNAGVPVEEDRFESGTMVFSFPRKAPEGARTVADVSAMQQLEMWKTYQDHWCEHKPSITVYYTDDEFLEIGAWVYENFESVSGISFLPYSDHVYPQAPYEAITKEQYEEMAKDFPTEFNWDISEEQDLTEGSQSLACVGGSCEI